MEVPPGDMVTASLDTSDPLGAGVGDAPLSFFPRAGGTFTILSSGLASSADDPDANNDECYQCGGFGDDVTYVLDGLNNSQGSDLVQLSITLSVPEPFVCLLFDFAFYSEESPDWIGGPFNDSFIAEVGAPGSASTFTIVANYVVAPNNIAFDPDGNTLDVNSAFGFDPANQNPDTGTTYDGTSGLLTASTQVTPGTQVEIVFSIMDLGDSILDAAVLLDNFRWTTDPPEVCQPGAQPAPQDLTLSISRSSVQVPVPFDAADLLTLSPGPFPPPVVAVPCPVLLPFPSVFCQAWGGGPPFDDVNAGSLGQDFTLPPPDAPNPSAYLFFSVAPGSTGVVTTGVNNETVGCAPEPEADEFGSAATGSNYQYYDGDGVAPCANPPAPPLGLFEPGGDDLDVIDPLNFTTTGYPVYGTLDSTSGSVVAVPGNSAADIYVDPAGSGLVPYALAAQLGLDGGGSNTDDIDALCIRDDGDYEYTPANDIVWFSLTATSLSLTLAGDSPADIFAAPFTPGAPVVSAGQLGLLPGDELNALKCYQQPLHADTDADGFEDDLELHLGTDPLDNCPDDDEDDAWPLDMNQDTWVNPTDMLLFVYPLYSIGLLNTDPEWSPAVQRFDLIGDGAITVVADMVEPYHGVGMPVQCDGGTPHSTPYPEGGPVTMGVDPEITGNTASTLGDLEGCVRVDVAPADLHDGEADHAIDVYVTGDTQAPQAYDAWVSYDPERVGITEWGSPTTLTADCGPGSVWCDVADAGVFTPWTDVQVGPPDAEVATVIGVDVPNNKVLLSLDNAHSSGDPVYPPGVDDRIKCPGVGSATRQMPSRLSAAAFCDIYGIAGDGTIVRMHLDAKSAGHTCFSFPFAKAYLSSGARHPTVARPAMLAVNQECPTEDSDGDGVLDMCDVCPNDPDDDVDGDSICFGSGYVPPKTGDNDNCGLVANLGQEDFDEDGAGDACDCDDDNGGTPDNQEVRDGTNPLNAGDDLPLDTADDDNDAALNWVEDWCGTDPFDDCGDDCGGAMTDDAWAYDINMDCYANATDMLLFPAKIVNPTMPAELGVDRSYRCRYDLNGDSWVNATDMLLFPAKLDMPLECTNP